MINYTIDIKGQSFENSLNNYEPKKSLKHHFELNFTNIQKKNEIIEKFSFKCYNILKLLLDSMSM